MTHLEMNLYDGATGKTLFAEHVHDSSALLCKPGKLLIAYATTLRGPIAQMQHDGNGFLHYHLNEYTPETLAQDAVFRSFATAAGANDRTLAEEIYNNRPENKTA